MGYFVHMQCAVCYRAGYADVMPLMAFQKILIVDIQQDQAPDGRRILTFFVARSVVKAQPGRQAGYKSRLPGGHNEAFLVLPFQ